MAKRILVVDDSDIIRTYCRSVLQRAGYEVLEASNAHTARTLLKSTDVAFVLCDLNLPGIDGIQLIDAMHKDPKLAQLPAAILSVENHPKLHERADSAGVAAWLRKPCKSEDLLSVVGRFAGPA